MRQDRNIILWNPHSGVRVKTYLGHGYDVRDATISTDNSKFASCGGDKQVGAEVSSSSRVILITCDTQPSPQVFLWDVQSARFIRKFKGHDAVVNAVSEQGTGQRRHEEGGGAYRMCRDR